MLPIGFLLAGCSKETYSLVNLEADYKTLTDGCTAFKVNDIGDGKEIIIDYSVYKNDGDKYLQHLIDEKPRYNQLKDFYNVMFNNSLTFVYEYLKDCSSDKINVPDTLALETKESLNQFKEAIKAVDSATSQMADAIRFAINENPEAPDEFNTRCMSELRNVFAKYDALLDSALNFSSAISRIYFNYAITASNVDYSRYHVSDSQDDDLNFKKSETVGLAIHHLTPKVKFQIVNLTHCLFEVNVKASNLPTTLTEGGGVGDFFTTYKTSVANINKELDSRKASKIMEDTTNAKAEELLNYLVRLYNVQRSINNDTEMYLTAFAQIDYLKVKSDANATLTERMCANIIENYDAIIQDYQEVLTDLVTFIVEL